MAAPDPAKLAKGSADLRYLLTQHRVTDTAQATLFEAGIDTVAKFSASFSGESDLKDVLARDFSIDPTTGLQARALAASFVVAWQAAQARSRNQAEIEAANELREWAKPIPQTDYMAMRQAFASKFGEPEDKQNEVLSRDEIDPEVLVPQWDSKGTVVLKKASSKGAMPSGPEQLRLRLNHHAECPPDDRATSPRESRDQGYRLPALREIQGLSPGRVLLRAKNQRG